MKKLLVLIFMAVILAPMPWGIAINPGTGQCTGYWGGDEYFSYDLPQGWEAYYPEGGKIETPYGSCTWDTAMGEREKNCCQQLGLPYLDQELGSRHLTGYTWVILGMLCCGGLLALGIIVLLIFGVIRLVKAILRRSQKYQSES